MDLDIMVVSDVVCPWCYIGKRRMEKALSELGDERRVRVAWLPFQLNPAMPREGLDRSLYRKARFDGLDASLALDRLLAEAGEAEGIPFDFDRIRRVPNTFDAHRLVWLARAVGIQDMAVEELFARYFTEGEDIGDRGVLLDVAGDLGLDRTPVERFLAEGAGSEEVGAEEAAVRRLGITAVPTYLLNGRYVVKGAQNPGAFTAIFEEVIRLSERGAA
jgi:predicted DsbA family dithiol-disulfide isomerase